MRSLISSAIAKCTGLELQSIEGSLTYPPKAELGDLSFPCFQLSKSWGAPPNLCAERLSKEIGGIKGVIRAASTGPYLNFFFDRVTFVGSVLNKILFEKSPPISQKKRIIIEYSSPNIAKIFHVGHLRTTLIGHCLVQVNKYLGNEVIGINHLGDWGTQFGFVFAGCALWGKPSNPNVESLVGLYQKATNLRKAQEEGRVPEEDRSKRNVDDLAKEYFVRLEAGDKEAKEFWQWCVDLSLDYFKKVYDRLGITFDHYTGESFYHSSLLNVEAMLKSSHILQESEGDLGIDLGKLGFVRIFTSDGRSLYITRDIAAAIYRENTFHADKILYVVGAAQSLHFQQLIQILKRLNHPVASKMVHIPFGNVPGMSTREGTAIWLSELFEEAHKRALETYRQQVAKRPESVDEGKIAELVAVGAMYYYFLSKSNIKDFKFDWKMALNFQGDSGPYLQYAVARINSIEAKAALAGLLPTSTPDFSLLKEDSAYELVGWLSRFDEAVFRAGTTNEPYHITSYLSDLAKLFSKAYMDIKVVDVEKGLAQARLSLFLATREVLKKGMGLIGVPVIERM